MSKRVRSNLKSARKVLLEAEDKQIDRVERFVERSVNEGADKMIEVIDTSGTGWVGKGARATPEGRIDTGRMRDSVSNEVTRTRKNITGVMGWGVAGRDAEHYFLDQEEGFINPWTGEFVPPMLALRQASIEQQKSFIERMRRAGF